MGVSSCALTPPFWLSDITFCLLPGGRAQGSFCNRDVNSNLCVHSEITLLLIAQQTIFLFSFQVLTSPTWIASKSLILSWPIHKKMWWCSTTQIGWSLPWSFQLKQFPSYSMLWSEAMRLLIWQAGRLCWYKDLVVDKVVCLRLWAKRFRYLFHTNLVLVFSGQSSYICLLAWYLILVVYRLHSYNLREYL